MIEALWQAVAVGCCLVAAGSLVVFFGCVEEWFCGMSREEIVEARVFQAVGREFYDINERYNRQAYTDWWLGGSAAANGRDVLLRQGGADDEV